MTFYERYETLCAEQGLAPQCREMLAVLDIKSPAISGWKRGSSPKIEYVCKLARYFNVSTDYLLGLSELRNPDTPLAEDEVLLLAAYRSADTKGKFQIIQACMNER